jgi:hypothetical protein
MKKLQILVTVALALGNVAAMAQWQWIDKDGRKVFSDRAPPAEVLDKNILGRPMGRLQSSTAAETDPNTNDTAQNKTPTAAIAAPLGAGVDKDLEAKKKQASDALAAKKKDEEQRLTKARIENCARAKQAKTGYESGIRIARTNEAGERVILDDAARAEEIKRIESVIASDCR